LGVGRFEKGARDNVGVGRGWFVVGVIGDETRGEEIEGEGEPENPFVICVEAVVVVVVLVLLRPIAMFV